MFELNFKTLDVMREKRKAVRQSKASNKKDSYFVREEENR